MTMALRKAAAVRLRELLDDPELHARALREHKKLRSLAFGIVCAEYKIDRATLYRYCKRFGISTK